MTYSNLGLAELEQLLAEIKAIYIETDASSKEDLLNSLQTIKGQTLARNNIVEMKIAYARECLKDTHKCVYVKDSDTDNFIVISNEFGPINKICSGLVSFYSSEFNTRPIDMPIYCFVFGPTEDLAWLNAYNKLIAIDRSKL